MQTLLRLLGARIASIVSNIMILTATFFIVFAKIGTSEQMQTAFVMKQKGYRMTRYIDSSEEMLLKSAISAKQTAYNNYKRLFVKWLESTWIGDNGEFCYLTNNYYELVEKADEEFKRATIEVEHYRMKVGNE